MAGAFAVVAVALAILYLRAISASVPETLVDIATPATTRPASFALSPDGRKIAYVAQGNGVQCLWVRSLDSIAAQPLPGTDGAFCPFWSPDGRSLGFFAEQKLRRIDLGGGQPQTLTDTIGGGGPSPQGTWGADGVILFNAGSPTPLSRVPASGGRATAATKQEKQMPGRA